MTVKTSSATGTLSARLETAMKLPNGARFYRCALQVKGHHALDAAVDKLYRSTAT
jgi:hypothetical protein